MLHTASLSTSATSRTIRSAQSQGPVVEQPVWKPGPDIEPFLPLSYSKRAAFEDTW